MVTYIHIYWLIGYWLIGTPKPLIEHIFHPIRESPET